MENNIKQKSKKQQTQRPITKTNTSLATTTQMVNNQVTSCPNDTTYLDKELNENKKILNELRTSYILALKKANNANNQAKYYCIICNFFINTLDQAQKHKTNSQHLKKFEKIGTLETKLFSYKVPNKLALNELSKHLIDVYYRLSPTQNEMRERFELFSRVKLILLEKYPQCCVNLYGSSLSGCCFKDSPLDIDIYIDSISTNDTLDLVKNTLADIFTHDSFKHGPNFRLNAKTPQGLCVQFSRACPKYWNQTSTLCRLYSQLDDRMRVLSLCFRNVARMAKLDKPDLNTLPAHAFTLMTIYFLQNIKPCVLPCLHEMLLQDPFDGDCDSNEFIKKCESYVNRHEWKSENSDDLGLLWLKLLTFYSIDYSFHENFLTLRTTKTVSKNVVRFFGKKISIEDPFHPKQNLCRSLLIETNEYLFCTIRKICCYYFDNLMKYDVDSSFNLKFIDELVKQTSIQTKDYINFKEIDVELRKEICQLLKIDYSQVSLPKRRAISESFDANTKSLTLKSSLSMNFTDALPNEIDSLVLIDESIDDSESSDHEIVKSCVDYLVENVASVTELIFKEMPDVGLKNEKYSSSDSNAPKLFDLHFESAYFGIDENGPPLICTFCNKEGHLSRDCPQDSLPKPLELPKISFKWSTLITKVCCQIMENNCQTREEEKARNNLLDLLKSIVRQKYPDAQLRLFGSSGNGFGTKKSDLDICMTLDRYGNSCDVQNETSIMKDVEKLLRCNRDFDSIEFRGRAKVPIVKFRHWKLNLEGDISFYNTLGLHNTNLLRSYVKIDRRLQVLGYVVKYFAKICNIGDASCGSLSSYAYIIMMIHYLIKCDPPVLPCLQKLTCSKHQEQQVHIGGWNCWFYPEVDNLCNVWEHHGKNKQSIGDLWLGFLKYYTEEFDWKNQVITIATNDVLTRKAKGWIKSRMNIEDPFELSHNLASGVSDKMSIFILKTFQMARTHFSNESNIENQEIKFSISYFFNPRLIIEGAPPMDRCCYSCNRIGHITRDCPNLDFTNGKQVRLKVKQVVSIQCFKCQEIGHISRDCPLKTIKKHQQQQQQQQPIISTSPMKHSLQPMINANSYQNGQYHFQSLNGYNHNYMHYQQLHQHHQQKQQQQSHMVVYRNLSPVPISQMPQSFHSQQQHHQQSYSHHIPQSYIVKNTNHDNGY